MAIKKDKSYIDLDDLIGGEEIMVPQALADPNIFKTQEVGRQAQNILDSNKPKVNVVERFGNFLMNPENLANIAEIGAAMSRKDSPGQRVGATVAQQAREEQLKDARSAFAQKLISGDPISDEDIENVPYEDVLKGLQFKEQQATAQVSRENVKAQTAGMGTFEEKTRQQIAMYNAETERMINEISAKGIADEKLEEFKDKLRDTPANIREVQETDENGQVWNVWKGTYIKGGQPVVQEFGRTKLEDVQGEDRMNKVGGGTAAWNALYKNFKSVALNLLADYYTEDTMNLIMSDGGELDAVFASSPGGQAFTTVMHTLLKDAMFKGQIRPGYLGVEVNPADYQPTNIYEKYASKDSQMRPDAVFKELGLTKLLAEIRATDDNTTNRTDRNRKNKPAVNFVD